MHENTREWHSSPSVAQHLRFKRPLSTGDRDLTIGRIGGRNRSKSIHSTHESVIRYQELTESPINSNNTKSNSISSNNNYLNSNSNTSNVWSNDCINSQTSDSNINYLYRNFNDCTTDSNIDVLNSALNSTLNSALNSTLNSALNSTLNSTLNATSGIDISPTFDYQFNSSVHMPSVGEYLNSASHSSCPTFNANVQHNYVKNHLKSTIASNTITSTNKEFRIFRASSYANNSYLDGENTIKYDTNSNKQIFNENAAEFRSSNGSDGSDEITTNSNCFIKSTSILKQLLRNKVTTSATLNATESNGNNTCHSIPTKAEKAQFRRSLDSATNLVFHRRNGLPLTSSPAPMRKSGTCFDFDSSLTSVNAIKKALFEKDPDVDVEVEKQQTLSLSTSAPASTTISSLLGNFEESVLNGRLEPASTVHGFTAEIGASGSFCPRHKTLPVTVFFYTLQDTDKADKVSSPYLGHINLGKKGYHVPRKGTVQATLFNPHGTVVKMFVVRYDLSDMPPNSQTFLRQRTLFMPSDAHESDADNRKWLRYLIHLRFESSKSGRIYLHTDVRIIVFRKHDLDVATINGQRPYELRSFTTCPINPKYS